MVKLSDFEIGQAYQNKPERRPQAKFSGVRRV